MVYSPYQCLQFTYTLGKEERPYSFRLLLPLQLLKTDRFPQAASLGHSRQRLHERDPIVQIAFGTSGASAYD